MLISDNEGVAIFLKRIGFVLALLACSPVMAAIESVTTDDGTEITISAYPAVGDRLFIWLPSEAGPQVNEETIAEELANAGVEVWRVDPVEARFLPVAQSSLDQLPDGDVSAILAHAAQQSRKRLFVVTTGRGVIPVLRGVRHWQQTAGDTTRLGGVILMSPMLFVETPDPGAEAALMPIARATNAPLYVLQPEQSPWYWKLDITLPALERGGSDVFVRLLRGVRDRFYFRPDATSAEDALRERLPNLLKNAATALDTLPPKQRNAVSLQPSPVARVGKKERELLPFGGDPIPPPLALANLAGGNKTLSDYAGQVVLVNFWASWCPPCVHEMPSMERLSARLAGEPFVILGVNMAEPPQVVREFLDVLRNTKVAVTFPILLDRDGAALKRWQVFAFPTSFVIDKKGRIRYALFGAMEWDDEKVIAKIQALLRESE